SDADTRQQDSRGERGPPKLTHGHALRKKKVIPCTLFILGRRRLPLACHPFPILTRHARKSIQGIGLVEKFIKWHKLGQLMSKSKGAPDVGFQINLPTSPARMRGDS